MATSKLDITEKPDLEKARSRVRQEIPVVRDEIVVPERLVQFAQGKKYFIRTYGCQANVRDEENMRGLLELSGFSSVDDEKLADLVIINTCAIRENAEDKVFGELGILKGLKAIKPEMLIAVSGCMVQQTHIVDTITQKYRHVDLMFGTHNIHHLLELIDESITKKTRVVNVPSKYGEIVESMPSKRNHRFKAFVNIMYGCDKFCTYCIVPYTRGKERSRLMDDVIKECSQLVEDGYQEITLVGQNVNSYGKDFKNGTNFAQLLEAIAKTGIPRLRFMTSHPWDFTDEMIDMIAKYDNIMNHIHLPFQAGDDMILRLMARRYTVASYLALVEKMKSKIPQVTLTTDIIVGFPNETEAQFEGTMDLVRKVGFDATYTFIYSPRKGTPAYKMVDNVLYEEKQKRFYRLKTLVDEIAKAKADLMVGQTYAVLVDGVSKNNPEKLSAYTESNKLVHFKGDANLAGKIVRVRIDEANTYTLFGTLVDDQA
jgi:tRNA-2-methylthio-N6-dimethylallyladenosine synthase